MRNPSRGWFHFADSDSCIGGGHGGCGGRGRPGGSRSCCAPGRRPVPGPPRGVKATPGNRAAVVKWTAPADNGGRPITGYVATASPGSETCTTTGATTCTVHGLVNGHTYSISVKASNKKGFGAPSAAVTVKPGLPLAPTHVKATPGNGFAAISWTAPANNGSRITKYTVTTTPSFKRCTTSGTRTCTVTGLTNGTTYRFKVTATNAFGTGAPSAASAPATPPVVRTISGRHGSQRHLLGRRSRLGYECLERIGHRAQCLQWIGGPFVHLCRQ